MTAVPTSRYFVFFSIAIVGCLTDLATKSWVFQWLGRSPHVYWLWQDFVGLQTSLNHGALFGYGQGLVWLFVVLSMVAALVIFIWLFYSGAAVDWLLTVALGCVTAGIFGNLYDRLGLHGLKSLDPTRLGETEYAVRDFILLQAGNPAWRWPNFNVADSLLVCGTGLLIWHALQVKSEIRISKS